MVTTETISGYEIQEYLGYVSETVTLGINDFVEMFLIADTLGGESSMYNNKFEAAKRRLDKKIENKIKEMGGNAVIGLRISYNEITGRGKSSLLVSGTGTAVKIDLPAELKLKMLDKELKEKEENAKKLSEISIDEIYKLSIDELIKKLETISEEERKSLKYFALKREDVEQVVEEFRIYETDLLERKTQHYSKKAKLALLLRK